MSSTGVLGKRKRKAAAKAEPEPDTAALEDAQAIFRRYFEAQFAPIQDSKKSLKQSGANLKKAAGGIEEGEDDKDDDAGGVEDMRSDSESDENAWNGLSGEEDSEDDDSEGDEEDVGDDPEPGTTAVQVVDHSKPLPTSTIPPQLATMTKRELRAYLSSRPPDATAKELVNNSKSKQQPGEKDDPQNEDSKTLLANDLELQRLISESHILSASNPFNSIGSRSSTADGVKTFVQGRTRALTTDLRLQQLGSKSSILTQRKMPMGMRKGINAAKGAKEDKRRREARENGIILEKEDKGKKGGKRSKRRGDLAVDMPGMGRFQGGELKLSKREVRAVEMEGMRMDRGGKRRRRRR